VAKNGAADGTAMVDEYMAGLDHPLKAETETLRATIKGVHPQITEEVKWNAPSFSYRGEYLVTFNLRKPEHVHPVFHNPLVVDVSSDLLEGDYPDGRRMAYFRDMADVQSRRTALERVIGELVTKIDEQ
jgi:uncharacterized protein YdhG (YjbR/CyaY superfamily)